MRWTHDRDLVGFYQRGGSKQPSGDTMLELRSRRRFCHPCESSTVTSYRDRSSRSRRKEKNASQSTPPSVSAHPQAIPDQVPSPLPLLRLYSSCDNLLNSLFDSSEKRLARVPLLLAHVHSTGGNPETVMAKIGQETCAEMINAHAVS